MIYWILAICKIYCVILVTKMEKHSLENGGVELQERLCGGELDNSVSVNVLGRGHPGGLRTLMMVLSAGGFRTSNELEDIDGLHICGKGSWCA